MKVSEFQNLEYRVEDRVAYLRLTRPEALNSFSSRLYGEVKWAFRHVSYDDNVDMAVITGTGRSFATGGDLKETLARLNDKDDPLSMYEFFDRTPWSSLRDCKKTTIAAINGTSLEVQNPTTGQVTVNYTSTTTFRQTVTASGSAVTVGSCISAFGKPTSGSSSSKSAFGSPVTATTVSVSQPASGTCTGGFGGRPGGATPGGGGSSTPGTGTRPAGASRFGNGQFGAASGEVTAVNGSVVTINETNPTTKAASSVAVTLTSTTTFTTTGTASSTDLAVGKCARANGSADTTGAIAAQSITISTPGPDGCTSGFGGFRGGAGGAGAGGAGASA